MKFDARRHTPHPVLAPTNDDYPNAHLNVIVSDVSQIDNNVCFSIEFELSQPTIAATVESGQASCKAMVYCRGTLFRQDLEAAQGTFTIQAVLPVDELMGVVEIHPFIVSTQAIDLAPDAVHREYQDYHAVLSVSQRKPLAAAHRREFEITPQRHNMDSLFIFQTDPDNPLPPGQFDIVLEPNERQIAILVNENDHDQLMTLRSQRVMSVPSMYMSAMVQAFSYLEYADEDDQDDVPPNGWFQYLSSRKIPDVSPFRMAQAVFNQPFLRLIETIQQQ